MTIHSTRMATVTNILGRRVPLVAGLLVATALTAQAQQQPQMPGQTGANKPMSASDSALCNAAAAYLKDNPAEEQRMAQAAMKIMQSPETQQMVQTLMEDLVRSGTGKAGSSNQLAFDSNAIPNSLRVPFADALANNQLDRMKALLRSTGAATPAELAAVELTVKMTEILPDSLRSLYAESMRRGGAMTCS